MTECSGARAPLTGKAEIGLKVGEVLNRHKMAKHFDLTIGDHSFSFQRKVEAITEEAALDGLYVVRTNLPAEALGDAETVLAYKSLSRGRTSLSLDQDRRPRGASHLPLGLAPG